jgi:hypothetical protein
VSKNLLVFETHQQDADATFANEEVCSPNLPNQPVQVTCNLLPPLRWHSTSRKLFWKIAIKEVDVDLLAAYDIL